MRLADFIRANTDRIIVQWEAFAATLQPAAGGLSRLALRDHAPEILAAVVQDLALPQTRDEQAAKSMGRAPVAEGAPQTAAQTHAVLRARGGFDINQLVAEYRALRASVLRLWLDDAPPDAHGVQDMVRFNEAIDQAVAESIGHFHQHVEQARSLLLGMVGHDMRSPLNAIVATGAYLAALNAGEQVSTAAVRLIRSCESMRALLDDLVDFNRTRLGLGIKVVPTEIDLAVPVTDEVEQLRTLHPQRPIELHISGDARGCWDGARLQQLLRNLLANALAYGTPGTPVAVALHAQADRVRLEVRNNGPAIDAAVMGRIFDPLWRGTPAGEPTGSEGLGLGLFIVREIARAHGGTVEAGTDGGCTRFAVDLPRSQAAQ